MAGGGEVVTGDHPHQLQLGGAVGEQIVLCPEVDW